MRVLQLNLNHTRAAQDLLMQMTREKDIDVILMSEPHRPMEGRSYLSDKTAGAAIWTAGKHALLETYGQAEGFARAKIKGIYFYSCYARPSWTIHEFQTMLDNIITDAKGRNPIIIAGDFNAWATEWGSRTTNQRGQNLLESFATLGVSLITDGLAHTFNRAGRSSIIDIAFASEALVPRTRTWVGDEYTHSDHQAVWTEIEDRKPVRPPKMTGPKWNDNVFDKGVFDMMLDDCVLTSGPANIMARELVDHMVAACDAAMPRRKQCKRGAPCYWWNDQIRANRAKCLKARRRSQRTRNGEEHERRLIEFRQARRELDRSIKESKRRCFKQIIADADVNPWGTAYRMVMSKIKGQKGPVLDCHRKLKDIVKHLFPTKLARMTSIVRDIDPTTIPPVTLDEITEAGKRVKEKKAPGPDGIPNSAIKAAIHRRPDMFQAVVQKCLDDGVFPEQWKLQQLVLLPKGDKSPDDPSAYRPICLLDTIGKILERIVYVRLLTVAENRGALSESQYGFRERRSTTDAIKTVVDTAAAAIEGERWLAGTKEYCSVVTLDIRNAFNSADWGQIQRSLIRMQAPHYLTRIIEHYLSERRLRYHTDEGPKYAQVTAGVPQGSVLGPLLWNIMYDGVLRLDLPGKVRLVGFADDVAIVTVAKHIHEIEAVTSEAIERIRRWLESAGLELADHKTEAVLITGRKQTETMTIRVGRERIESKRSLKYLGVLLDDRLNFRIHIGYCSEKAAKVQGALSRILPNIGGPKQERRLLLTRVVSSVLLYAAPVWAGVLKAQEARRRLTRPYRIAALRAISGFRTISDEAAFVLAGMIPIDILADEMSRIYDRRTGGVSPTSIKEIKNEERTISMERWQARWTDSTKGRWTNKLIPVIESWTGRAHGTCDYHLTQFLSGHGGYRKYLHKFGHDNLSECPECEGQEEDAEHIMFYCRRFEEGRPTSYPTRIVEHMTQSSENWDEVTRYATQTNTELRRLERARRASEETIA